MTLIDQVELNEYRNDRNPLHEVVPLSTPYIIYLDPCGACNFKCNFCPCNTSDYMGTERHKMMSWDLFIKAMDDIRQFDEQVKVIDLYANGEPLLNPRLPDMIRYIKENDISRETRITTNGSLLCPAINAKLVDAGIDLIRISVESLYGEDYRKMCGYDIDYDAFVSNIRDLYERSRERAKISVKILTAAFHDNEDIEKFRAIFEPISDYRTVQKILDNMWSEFDDIVISSGGSTYVTNENVIQEGWTICAMPLTMMTIHSNGLVGVCPQDWKFGTKYGDIKKESLKDAWNSQQLYYMRMMHVMGRRKELPYCKGCICVADDNVDDVADIIVDRLRNDWEANGGEEVVF